MKKLIVCVASALALVAFTPTAAQAMTASDAVHLLGGNYNWYNAGDDDYSKEWNYYQSLGWDVVDFDNGALPPGGHDLTIWSWFKTKNGTYLWTQFEVRDPYASADGNYHDWVKQRTR